MLVLGKADDKEFILRNTQVMYRSGSTIDSTKIADDLTFNFKNIKDDSAAIFLKSPVLSPKAVIKFRLRKNKPTRIKIDYPAIHNFSIHPESIKNDHDDFAHFSSVMTLLETFVILFTALHR